MGIEDILFKENNNKKIEDKQFIRDMNCEIFENKILVRATAKQLSFSHVKFNYCIFEHCYFRQCVFDSCEFIGCKFISSNFYGSNFVGCNFIYSTFEKTLVELDSLMGSLPPEENLRAKLLRSLRVNFQQQGDVNSVNRVIRLELKAAKEHLLKSWVSNKIYYRGKYKEWDRFKKFIEWTTFQLLDLIWGNGESVYKLCRTVLLILSIISIHEIYYLKNSDSTSDIIQAILNSPSIFFGIHNTTTTNFGEITLTIIYFIRLVIFGLFMSILIKRISRR